MAEVPRFKSSVALQALDTPSRGPSLDEAQAKENLGKRFVEVQKGLGAFFKEKTESNGLFKEWANATAINIVGPAVALGVDQDTSGDGRTLIESARKQVNEGEDGKAFLEKDWGSPERNFIVRTAVEKAFANKSKFFLEETMRRSNTDDKKQIADLLNKQKTNVANDPSIANIMESITSSAVGLTMATKEGKLKVSDLRSTIDVTKRSMIMSGIQANIDLKTSDGFDRARQVVNTFAPLVTGENSQGINAGDPSSTEWIKVQHERIDKAEDLEFKRMDAKTKRKMVARDDARKEADIAFNQELVVMAQFADKNPDIIEAIDSMLDDKLSKGQISKGTYDTHKRLSVEAPSKKVSQQTFVKRQLQIYTDSSLTRHSLNELLQSDAAAKKLTYPDWAKLATMFKDKKKTEDKMSDADRRLMNVAVSNLAARFKAKPVGNGMFEYLDTNQNEQLLLAVEQLNQNFFGPKSPTRGDVRGSYDAIPAGTGLPNSGMTFDAGEFEENKYNHLRTTPVYSDADLKPIYDEAHRVTKLFNRSNSGVVNEVTRRNYFNRVKEIYALLKMKKEELELRKTGFKIPDISGPKPPRSEQRKKEE